MSVEMTFQHMGYHSGVADAGLATALAIEAAAGDKSIWTAFMPMQVERVGVLVTVAINYDTPTALMVMAFDRRVTYGSDTGRVEMGRVTIPNGTAAGTVIYLNIPHADGEDSGSVMAGGQIVSEIVTQGAGGGSIAGDFQPFICWQPRGEANANNLNGSSVVTLVEDTTTVQV
jgi:hypothetical protein